MSQQNVPHQWIGFLLTALNLVRIYKDFEPAIAAFRDGLNAEEREEVASFLDRVAAMTEGDCRRVIGDCGVLNGDLYAPVKCKKFYALASEVFSRD